MIGAGCPELSVSEVRQRVREVSGHVAAKPAPDPASPAAPDGNHLRAGTGHGLLEFSPEAMPIGNGPIPHSPSTELPYHPQTEECGMRQATVVRLRHTCADELVGLLTHGAAAERVADAAVTATSRGRSAPDNGRGAVDNGRGAVDNRRGAVDNRRGDVDNRRGDVDNRRGDVDTRPLVTDNRLMAADRSPGSVAASPLSADQRAAALAVVSRRMESWRAPIEREQPSLRSFGTRPAERIVYVGGALRGATADAGYSETLTQVL